MGKWIPDRKYLAGGITGILSFIILTAAGSFGFPIDAAMAAQIAGGLMLLVSYFTPQSVDDIVSRVDGKIISIVAEKNPTAITAAAPAISANPTIPLVTKP